jgi:HAD superfamily hydrolase (TIGR01509 family)
MSDFAVIFDMDGVIVDSNPFHKVSLQAFCNRYGFTFTDAQLREKLFGRRNVDWIPALFGAHLTPEEILAYSLEKEAIYRDMYQHDIVPLQGLPGFLALLEEQKVKRAIATSAPPDNVAFTLGKTNLSHYFETIIDDTHVNRGKPDPEVYLKAAEALGVDPAHCVVFEDSLAGVEAGLRAGAKVVGISTTHTAEELANTHLVIPDFTGLTLERLAALFV